MIGIVIFSVAEDFKAKVEEKLVVQVEEVGSHVGFTGWEVRLYAFFDGLIEGVAVDLPGEAVKGDDEFAFVEVGFGFFVEIDVGGI